MSTLSKPRPHLRVPSWLPVFYGVGAVAMMPWIVHLQNTLPSQQPLTRWVMTWVGFDVIMLALIICIVVLAIKKSMWLSLALTALSSMLFADVWFDIMTANGSHEMNTAMLLAIFFELPWAILSICCAIWLHGQLISSTRKSQVPYISKT